MLILTRRIGESIIIGEGKDRVVITLLATKGGQSKIGINAPKNISIHREEISRRLDSANQEKENIDNF